MAWCEVYRGIEPVKVAAVMTMADRHSKRWRASGWASEPRQYVVEVDGGDMGELELVRLLMGLTDAEPNKPQVESAPAAPVKRADVPVPGQYL